MLDIVSGDDESVVKVTNIFVYNYIIYDLCL